MLDRCLIGIYVVQDGKFRIMNPIGLAYTGYCLELSGRDSDFLIHPEDRDEVRRNAGMLLRGQSSSRFEYRIITKDNRTCWILGSLAPIVFESRPAVLGYARGRSPGQQRA